MRISDWSSDVCSSDLFAAQFEQLLAAEHIGIVSPGTIVLVRINAADVQHGIDLVLAEYIFETTLVDLDLVRRNVGVGFDLAAAVDGNDMVASVQTSAHTLGQRASRSEERRVGKECVRTCRSRWSPYN